MQFLQTLGGGHFIRCIWNDFLQCILLARAKRKHNDEQTTSHEICNTRRLPETCRILEREGQTKKFYTFKL